MQAIEMTALAALGLGAASGGALYFAAHGRTMPGYARALVAALLVIAGAELASFLSGASRESAIGAYGLGLLFGYLAICLGPVLRTVCESETCGISGIPESVELGDHTPTNGPAQNRPPAAGCIALSPDVRVATENVDTEARTAISDIDALLLVVAERIATSRGRALNLLVNEERNLLRLKMSALAAIGISALSNKEIRVLSEDLKSQSQMLAAESGRIKSITGDRVALGRLLDSVQRLHKTVGRLG